MKIPTVTILDITLTDADEATTEALLLALSVLLRTTLPETVGVSLGQRPVYATTVLL